MLILGPSGGFYWCKQLTKLDNKAGGKHFDFFYRILYKAASTSKGIIRLILLRGN